MQQKVSGNSLLLQMHGEKREFYLLVKVRVEYNQVEVALQALHGPGEKVVFGAASLQDKPKLQHLVTAASQFL